LSGRDEGEVFRITSLPVSTAQRLLSKKTARMGDEGKAVGCVTLTALLSGGELHQNAPRSAPGDFASPVSLPYIFGVMSLRERREYYRGKARVE
jgi:hypothetical protein